MLVARLVGGKTETIDQLIAYYIPVSYYYNTEQG